jgi:DNA mismatch endonuclease (patch repair protein)
MTDIVNRETRSRMMAGIRGKNTRPEMRVRRYLHATGLRFRLHDRALPGSPDLVFPAHRIAIFVHGCFWHRHPFCKYATMPSERREFWLDKFAKNVVRDQRNLLALSQAGWAPLVIWECETRDEERLDELYWWIRAESITNRCAVKNQVSDQPFPLD